MLSQAKLRTMGGLISSEQFHLPSCRSLLSSTCDVNVCHVHSAHHRLACRTSGTYQCHLYVGRRQDAVGGSKQAEVQTTGMQKFRGKIQNIKHRRRVSEKSKTVRQTQT